MKVNLGGIVPLSTMDWPGRSSIVVFLRGCPLRCPHCHNRKLQDGSNFIDYHFLASRISSQVRGALHGSRGAGTSMGQIDLGEASEMVSCKPLVRSMVLSGGEPLMQPEQSARLLALARALGLSAGLETSGCFPNELGDLLARRMLDKVFLDIKTAFGELDYEKATGRKGIASAVLKSLQILMESGVPLEIRITIFPDMPSLFQVRQISDTIAAYEKEYKGNCLKSIVLQQGHPSESEPTFKLVTLETMRQLVDLFGTDRNVKIQAERSIDWEY